MQQEAEFFCLSWLPEIAVEDVLQPTKISSVPETYVVYKPALALSDESGEFDSPLTSEQSLNEPISNNDIQVAAQSFL